MEAAIRGQAGGWAMRSGLRRFGKFLLVLAGISFVLALFAYRELRRQVASGWIEERAARALQDAGIEARFGNIGLAEIGVVRLDVLALKPPTGPLKTLSIKQIELDYEWKRLIQSLYDRQAFRLEALRIVEPTLVVRLDPGKLPKRDKPLVIPPLPENSLLPRVEIEDGRFEITIEGDHPPLPVVIGDFDLVLGIPGGGKPIGYELGFRIDQAPVKVKGSFQPQDLSGEADFAIDGLDLTAMAPVIAARKLPVALREGKLGVKGKASRREGQLDYQVRVDLPALVLNVGAPLEESIITELHLEAVPDEVRLEKLGVTFGTQPPLVVTGRVKNFQDPRLEVDLSLDGFQVGAIERALSQQEDLPIPVTLLPTGTLKLAAGYSGPLPKSPAAAKEPPVWKVHFDVAGVKVDVAPKGYHGILDLKHLEVDLTPEAAYLRELALELPGVRATIGAAVETAGGPTVRLDPIQIEVDAAALLSGVDGLPPAVAEAAPTGGLTLDGKLKLSPALYLEQRGLELPRDAKKLRETIERDVRAFKATDPVERSRFVLALQKSLGVEGSASLEIPMLSARLPAAAGPLAGERGEVHGRIALTPDSAKMDGLVGRLMGVSVGIEGEGSLAPEGPTARARVRIPHKDSLDLGYLLALVPEELAVHARPFMLGGKLTVGVSAAMGPGVKHAEAQVVLKDLAARLLANPQDMVIHSPGLAITASWPKVKLEHARIDLPLGSLELEGEGDLEKRSGTVRVKTGGEGFDLARLPGIIPWSTHPVLYRVTPQGRLSFDLSAGGDAGKPWASAGTQLDVGGFHLAVQARSEDLTHLETARADLDLTAKEIPSTLRSLVADLPAALDRLPEHEQLKLALSVTKGATGPEVHGQASFLDARVTIGGTLPTSLPGEGWSVSTTAAIDSLDHLTGLLPPATAGLVSAVQPRLTVAVGTELRGEGDGIGARVSWDLKRLSARVDDLPRLVSLFPIDEVKRRKILKIPGPLSLDIEDGRGSLVTKVTWPPSPVPPPVSLDLQGYRGKLGVGPREITFGALPASVLLSPERVLVEKLPLLVLGQEIDVRVDLAKRADGRFFLDSRLEAPGLDLKYLEETLVPPELDLTLAGKLGFSVNVRGPPDRIDLLEFQGELGLQGIDVVHPRLKGYPMRIDGGKVLVLMDDIVIPEPENFKITFGSRTFAIPVRGSVKALAGVPHLYRADPKVIGPIILEKIGGKKRITDLVGEEQALRLIVDQVYKIKITVKVRDRADEFELKGPLTLEESQLFRQRTKQIVDKYTKMAKQDAAETMGFRKVIYGEDNYRMIPIDKVHLIVLDEGLNMVYPREIPFWRLTITPAEF